jgi:Flp pilus assembly protein TadD
LKETTGARRGHRGGHWTDGTRGRSVVEQHSAGPTSPAPGNGLGEVRQSSTEGITPTRAYSWVLVTSLVATVLVGAAWWHSRRAGIAPQTKAARVEQRLREAVARHPGSAAAHRELGRLHLRAQRPFEALWELEQTHSLDPHDPAASVDEATALAMARLYPAAEAKLQEAVAASPGSRVGRRELSALYLATARPDEALKVLQTAPDLAGWSDGQLLLGRTYEGLGTLDLARRAYARCIELTPEGTEGPFRLAHLLLTNREPQAAREVLTAARAKGPREGRLLVLLALTYSARWGSAEDRDRQGELLSAALHRGRGAAIPARLALAELDLRHRRFREGGQLLAPLAERDDLAAAHRGVAVALLGLGEPLEAHYHRGMAAVLEGQADRALPEFRALAAGSGDDSRAPQLISQAYAEMNQLNEALKAAQTLYQGGNRSAELLERLSTLSLLTYDRRAARRIGEEWRQAQPESGRPLAHLGKVALADLRLAEAVRFYEEAVATEPKSAQHLLGLADALSHQPSPANARRTIALLRQAVTLAPDDARAHYQLGVRLQQAGQLQEARQELLAALDDDASQPSGYSNLVQVATALQQPALARHFEALMRDVQGRQRAREAAWRERWGHPADARACYALALCLARDGALESAEPQLRRALELRPRWPEAARLMERIRRLLDGIDPDGRRLVQFLDERPMMTEDRMPRRGAEHAAKG